VWGRERDNVAPNERDQTVTWKAHCTVLHCVTGGMVLHCTALNSTPLHCYSPVLYCTVLCAEQQWELDWKLRLQVTPFTLLLLPSFPLFVSCLSSLPPLTYQATHILSLPYPLFLLRAIQSPHSPPLSSLTRP
jgi:hypothetical protein